MFRPRDKTLFNPINIFLYSSFYKKSLTSGDTNSLSSGSNKLAMDSSATVNHDHLKQYIVNFYPMDKGYFVMWQSDQLNAKESVLPVCDKPYHTNKFRTESGGDCSLAKLCITKWYITLYERLTTTSLIPVVCTTWSTKSGKVKDHSVDFIIDLSTARPKWRLDEPGLSGHSLYSLVNPAYANIYWYRLVW